MENKAIIDKANARLKAATYCPKKLAFLHAGISTGVTLLLAVVSHLLVASMDNAVGIAGLETRIILSFIQTCLLFATTLALPFWDLGYTRACVCYSKGQTPTPADLLSGFRKFAPALRLMLLRILAMGALVMMTMQAATFLFMLSPLSLTVMEKIEPLLSGTPAPTPELMAKIMPNFIPLYVIWAVVGIGVFLPIFYRFRLADFALMDDAKGAISAFSRSARQTKGRCKQLFLLDLGFWWYYLLLVLCVAVSYLDMLLPRLGIALNTDIAFWVFTVLGQLGNLTIAVFCTPKIKTAYAHFYQMRTNRQEAFIPASFIPETDTRNFPDKKA